MLKDPIQFEKPDYKIDLGIPVQFEKETAPMIVRNVQMKNIQKKIEGYEFKISYTLLTADMDDLGPEYYDRAAHELNEIGAKQSHEFSISNAQRQTDGTIKVEVRIFADRFSCERYMLRNYNESLMYRYITLHLLQ